VTSFQELFHDTLCSDLQVCETDQMT